MTPAPTLFPGLCALVACDVGGEEATDRGSPARVLRVTWDDGTVERALGDGAGEVWAPIDVWFDGFLDPDSVSTTAVRIESHEQAVRAAFLYDPLDRRVRLVPNRSLDPTLDYEVVVDGVRSFGGVEGAPSRHAFSSG